MCLFTLALPLSKGARQVRWEKDREGSSPGEVWDHDPGESVNQAEHGDPDEGEPPEPENQEVLLVEQVVGEDAQVVRPVDRSGGGADSDVASHLGDLDTSEEVDD